VEGFLRSKVTEEQEEKLGKIDEKQILEIILRIFRH
jgi:hypothetical protein